MSTPIKNISIGQVVYVLSKKTQTIVPAMVIEETTVNTLEGKKVTWKVAVGPEGAKRKIVDSADLNGEVFSSLEEVQNLLKKRLSEFVDKVVTDARKNENSWYGKIKNNKINTPSPPTTSNKIDPENLMPDFSGEDTSSYNEERMNFQKNMEIMSNEDQKADLKKQLLKKMAPSREELQSDVQFEEEVKIKSITGPDGILIPADFKV